MHDTAMEIGCLVMDRYADLARAKVLELGSYDVNGSLRSHAHPTTEYVGLDLEAGPGVDFVVEPGVPWPVQDDYFDLALASSVFEHDPMFWVTFLQMVRKVRKGGYVYVSAPSNGAVHRYPQDHWRFYPDSGVALERWACSQGEPVVLVESFTASRKTDHWNDFVAIFRRGKGTQGLPKRFIYEEVKSFNALTWNHRDLINPSQATEDMMLINDAQCRIKELDVQIEALDTLSRTNIDELEKAGRELLVVQARLDQELAGHEASRSRLIELSAQLERQAAKVETAEAMLAESQGLLSDQQSKNDELQRQIETEKAALVDADTRLRATDQELQNQRDELSRQAAELAAGMAARAQLEAEIREREAALVAAHEHIARSKEQMAAIESALIQRAEEIEQTRAELESLRSEYALAKEEMGRLQVRLSEAESWTFRLSGERKEWETRAERSERELARLKTQNRVAIERMGERLARSEGAESAIRAVSENLRAQLSLSEREGDALRSANADLEAQLTKRLQETAELTRTLQAAEAKIKERDVALVAARSDHFRETAELTQALRSAEMTLGEKEAAMLAVAAELDRSNLQNEQLLQQIRHQMDELNAANLARSESEQALRTRFEELARLTVIAGDEARRAGDAEDASQWLSSIRRLEESFPWWWSILPSAWRRQRINRRLFRAGLFDADAYLALYPDVAEEGMDPLRHYIFHGKAEGRVCSRPG